MSEPKRHHFLAQQGYLRFFSVGAKGEKIVVYRRGKAPFVTGLANAGVESELYSMVDERGGFDRRIETLVLSPLDQLASGLMERLNRKSNSVVLSPEEVVTLYTVVALAYLRTPAFRDGLHRYDAELLKNEASFDPTVRADLRRASVPETEIDTYIEAGLASVRKIAVHPNYWLVRVGRFLELTLEELHRKSAEILEADEVVITSDHPVAIDYDLGFQNSDVIFPVGSHRILLMRRGWPQGFDNSRIPIRRIAGAQARAINAHTIRLAESALFASVEREGISRLFDATERPARMRPSGALAASPI